MNTYGSKKKEQHFAIFNSPSDMSAKILSLHKKNNEIVTSAERNNDEYRVKGLSTLTLISIPMHYFTEILMLWPY